MRLDDLPIYPMLPEIARALAGGSLVLSAETGAGKTSAVPAYLASTGAIAGKAIVLEPRRLAAVSAAARVADILGTELGDAVGYRVRGDSRAGAHTKVEFVTEAVFVRMVQDDPLLSGVSIVAFDEFHERSAACDLGLAFAAEAREARGDLSILAMSATMDTERVAAYLGCPRIDSPGRLFPITMSYRPLLRGERPEEAAAMAALQALDATAGDVLVFLPGLREIGVAAARIAGARSDVDVMTLHGGLGLADQRAIVAPRPGARRRVILSTSVAETSLTVPRITAVVDAGLSRFIRYHAPSGLNRLVTERVSSAEAEQRRGRAGRLAPGLCIRCWDASDILQPSRGPELARIELAGVVLECAVRGAVAIGDVRWLDMPPAHAWDAAASALQAIGLRDERGRATDLGRRAAAMGADPRAAAAVLKAADADAASGEPGRRLGSAALAAAAVSERDAADSDGDFRSGLERIAAAGVTRGRVDDRTARIVAEAERLASRARGDRHGGTRGHFDMGAALAGIDSVGDLLAPGFPDRLARRLPDDSWEFPSGRRAKAVAAPSRAEWLIAVDVDAGDPLGYIRRSAPVDAKAAKSALLGMARATLEVVWRGLAASAWERTRAGAIVIVERRLERVPPDALGTAFADRVRSEGIEWLPWNDASRSVVERVRYMAARPSRVKNEDLRKLAAEDWDADGLGRAIAEAAVDWLSPAGPVIDEAGLYGVLGAMLGAALPALDAAAPPFVTTPGGKRRRPEYPAAGNARLSAKIQEFFGMADGPKACGESMTLELLSPAERPLQATSDLSGFWKNTYPAIRTEMARRYPRHYWPDNPLIAEATKGQKPRK